MNLAQDRADAQQLHDWLQRVCAKVERRAALCSALPKEDVGERWKMELPGEIAAMDAALAAGQR